MELRVRHGDAAEIDATITTLSRLRAAGVQLVVDGGGVSIAPHDSVGTLAKGSLVVVALSGHR